MLLLVEDLAQMSFAAFDAWSLGIWLARVQELVV